MKKPRRKSQTPAKQHPSQSQEPNNGQLVEHHMVAEWSGPLPPPSSLEAFERIVPGAAVRILDQFERETEHRHSMERALVTEDRRESMWGQALAGLFSLGALGVAAYAFSLGAFWAGAVIGGATIAGVVAAFLKGKARHK